VGNFVIVENGREIEIIFAVPGNLFTFYAAASSLLPTKCTTC
jgi:hypothetical protein